MSELLVVTTLCSGNICRSPLARLLPEKHLALKGVRQVEVRSAGLAAPRGQPATAAMLVVAESYGVDLSPHRSQSLELPAIRDSRLLLCAAAAQRDTVRARWPFLTPDRVALFQDAVPGAEGHDVRDPYGLGAADHELVGALIDRAMEFWAARLARKLGG